jgi:ABC-type phosphate transport system substrate-binding protein
VKRVRIRSASAGLALVAAAFIAIVFASVSGATAPSAGVGCQASDGKVTGRGATFQTGAENAFAAGYSTDVCGAVANDTGNTYAGTTMVGYNKYAAGSFGEPTLTGSGFGLKSAMCRADAFAGSDIPYFEDQLAALGTSPQTSSNYDALILGAAGRKCSDAAQFGITGGWAPPYQPKDSPPPNASDQAAPLMSFPIAGSSVAIGFNLSAACGANPVPTSLTFTGKQISLLFGGDIATWSDIRLRDSNGDGVADSNPGLSGCSGAVGRVVRLDNSGTTQIFKNYLTSVDPDRTSYDSIANTCDTGQTWGHVPAVESSANWENDGATPTPGHTGNYRWPGFVTAGVAGAPNGGPSPKNGQIAQGGCSQINTGDVNGNIGVLDVLERKDTNGNAIDGNPTTAGLGLIGYVDLADIRGASASQCPGGCKIASVVNATTGLPTNPFQGQKANCNFGAIVPPTGLSNNQAAVGLNASDNWSQDNSPNHGNVTNTGNLYPICGVTYALVYSKLSSAPATNPIVNLSDDQRRTLYSYFNYVLSSAGQSQLITKNYASLPTGTVDTLRGGFDFAF